MAKQIFKIGNSLGLTIPTGEVKRLKLKPGDKVEFYADGQSLRIVPLNRIRPVRLGGICKGVDISEEEIKEMRKEMWGRLAR